MTQRAYVRAHWLALLTYGGLVLAPSLVMVPLIRNSFARGLVTGTLLTGTVGFLAFLVVQLTGTGPTMMGDLAEHWTADALRHLRRQGWQVANHVVLAHGDIDHVLIGAGGAFVVETKWRGGGWREPSAAPQLERACLQIADQARRLRLWTSSRKLDIPVNAVVVTWGWDGLSDSGMVAEEEYAVRRVGEVDVVPGYHLERWFAEHDHPLLSAEQVESAWGMVAETVTRRDAFEADCQPMPASIGLLAARLGGLLALVVLAAAAVMAVLAVTTSLPGMWLGAAVLLAPAAGARVSGRWHVAGWAWAFGVVTTAMGLSLAALAATI